MDYLPYLAEKRRLELHGQRLRCIIVTIAFRLALQELVEGWSELGQALRRWYRDQR